jgi:hypothetical protein
MESLAGTTEGERKLIRVIRALEPADFDAKVRQPGYRAIAEMTGQTPCPPRTAGKRFEQCMKQVVQTDGTKTRVLITDPAELPSSALPSYWTNSIDDLMDAYHEVCAYSCFRIHRVTGTPSVDHMAPKSGAWNRVYGWENYRLAALLLNARKKDFSDVLDPFEIQDDWFELDLVGFQVRARHGLKDPVRTQVEGTIKRLGLNKKVFRDKREENALDYLEGDVSLGILERESPFVAKELRRQGRLLDGDA